MNITPHEEYAKYVLFNTQLKSAAKTILSVIYRNNSEQTSMLCVTSETGGESCISLSPTAQWQRAEIALKDDLLTQITIQSRASKTIQTIHLGQIYIGKPEAVIAPVSSLKYTTRLGKTFIEWKKTNGAAYYDIYKIMTNEPMFVARTYNTFFCIDDDPHTKYIVESRALDTRR